MKVCQIYNTLPHYREGIYTLLDETFDTDWYHGRVPGGIKEMDYSKLRGDVFDIDNHYYFHGKMYWQSGVLRTLFKPYDIYIILGDEWCISTWVFLFFKCFFSKKKLYFWSHGQYGREGRLKNLIQRLFWSFVDGGFIYGYYAKEIMTQNGFNPSRLYVVHNSLNYNEQLKLRNEVRETDVYYHHFGNRNPVLLVIGRINIRKKLSLLLDSVNYLKSKGRNYNIVIIGDGEDKQALESKTNELDLTEQVWFYGACYDELTNAELIYNADMCVVPGDIGLTAIHCLTFGIPIITHNNFVTQGPEFEAINAGLTGDFFEYDNITSLANTISHWFDSHLNDRDLVRKRCFEEVDKQWNPYYQIEVFKGVLQ